jgi:hypothetical protein
MIGGRGILDMGGSGESFSRRGSGGGGSGGGIFLHADAVTLDSALNAMGGNAGFGPGGGGGGRVLILTGSDGFSGSGTINVAGTQGGESGTVTINGAPEPSTLVLLGLGGALALLDYARRRRKRVAGRTG